MDIVHNVFAPETYKSEYPSYYTPACVPTPNPGLQVKAVREKCVMLNDALGHVLSLSPGPYTTVGTFVSGVTDIPPDLKPLEASTEWKLKEAGTFKEWKAAKKDSVMLLRDMTVGKVKISARPKIVADTVAVTLASANLNQYLVRSACDSSYWKLDDGNSYVNVSNQLKFRRTTYKGATALPWPSSLLQDLTHDMRRIMSLQEVDRSIVTGLTAEANSSVMDLATEVAELPETVTMIINALIAAVEMYRDARRKVAKLPADAVTDIASLWMGYRYGVQPIAYSVLDMLDVLDYQTRNFRTFRSGGLQPLVDDASKFSFGPQPDCIHRCFIKQRLGTDTGVGQRFRVNLVTTAWELLPLSFVVDWFFSVGDYLTSVFTPAMVADRVTQYSWRSSSKFTASYDGFVSIVELDAYRSEKIDPGNYRTLLQPFWLNWKRQLDAASLLWLLTRRNPK